jgi:PAS domain S-box-containing protein
MAIHLLGIVFLPVYSTSITLDHLLPVTFLLSIVYFLTFAFTRLKEWDMNRINETMKLLQVKQNRIDSLFDNEFYAIVVHSNGKIYDINNTFTSMFQYKINEIIDLNLLTLLFKDNHESKDNIINFKSEFNIEAVAYKKDLSELPIEITGRRFDEDGSNLNICFIRDISSKKQMYSEIMKHKNYLQRILDALPYAIFVRDIHSMEIRTANKVAFKEYGEDSKNPQSKNIISNSTEYLRGLELVRKTKLPLTIEESHVYQTGVEKYIEMYIHPFLNQSGEIDELLEIIMDITVRKKIEQRLKKTLKELRDIRDALDEHAIVSITDPAGNITYVNEKFIITSGFTKDELIGQNHRIIKSGEHSKAFFKELWSIISSGKIWQGEIRNKSKNGNFYWVSSTIVPFLDENNKPYQYVSIRTEITEQKNITNQLKIAKDEAEKANHAKTTFLANMSHEIRTPLNAVLGMTELTLATGPTPIQRKYLSLIQSSGENLLNIINEILDFSKIEAGKLVIENNDFNLRHIIFSTLHIFIFQAKEKNLKMSVHIYTNVPDHLIGDQQRIRQILINLVGNSLKFTEKGNILIEIDAINFKADSDEITLKFTVADSGIGIPVSKQKMIFESFTQEDSSTTRKYGGTGLGTTISRELTAKMGGEMGVISPIRHYHFSSGGSGSEFWFTIKCKVNKDLENVFPDRIRKRNIKAINVIIDKDIESIVKKYYETVGIEFHNFSLDLSKGTKLPYTEPDLILIEMRQSIDELSNLLNNLHQIITVSGYTRIVLIMDDNHDIDTPLLYDMGVSYYVYKPLNDLSILRMFNFIMHDSQHSVMFPSRLPNESEKSYEIQNGKESKDVIKILVAEDNMVNQLLIKTILENMKYEVSLASNGIEAISLLNENPGKFSLIFMDLQMPEMNGLQATQKIREKISKTIPIIAVTANAFQEDQEKSIQAGMDDFIAKPYNKESLAAIIRKYLKGD